MKLDIEHFGDAASLFAADAITASPDAVGLVAELLRGGSVEVAPASSIEVAALARHAAIYADEFKKFYALTGSKSAYGDPDFDEIVDDFQREVMRIDPDYLEYHYPSLIVFDYCRHQ